MTERLLIQLKKALLKLYIKKQRKYNPSKQISTSISKEFTTYCDVEP